jgi:hypothetical protein
MVKPWRVVGLVKIELATYIIFTLILGQVAIYLPIILSLINKQDAFSSFVLMQESGTLYNTLIPLIATSIFSIIYDVGFLKQNEFSRYKLFILSINIIIMFSSAFLYADILKSSNNIKIILQWVIYLVAIYYFIISFLSQFMVFKMDSFQDIDDTRVTLLREKSRKVKSTKDGRTV